MFASNLRLRCVLGLAQRLCSFYALTAIILAGCCHGPTVTTHSTVCADGTITNQSPTPGNSGPLYPFTVPRQDGCNGGPSVAVITVDGILLDMDMVGPSSTGENPVSLFREQLDEAAADPCTRAVVVRINSYGGSAAASDIMRHELEQFKGRTRLPVVACITGTGAGGAYYLATAADQIVAMPISVVGGVGVILNMYNLCDLMQARDVKEAMVKSGENIDIGSMLRLDDVNKTQRDILQGLADWYHARFKEVITKARPAMNPNQPEIYDGRIFTGAQAVQLHMIDSLGYLDEAIRTAGGMAGTPEPRSVMYRRCNDRARSIYSVTPNTPLQGQMMPMNIPGYDRASLPTFLYMWQPEPTMERLGGH
jgi:protease IV